MLPPVSSFAPPDVVAGFHLLFGSLLFAARRSLGEASLARTVIAQRITEDWLMTLYTLNEARKCVDNERE